MAARTLGSYVQILLETWSSSLYLTCDCLTIDRKGVCAK
jgi:hypothetical protein